MQSLPKKSSSALVGLIVLVSIVGTGLAWAHSGASGAVKVRMDTMKDIADEMKAIATTLRNGEVREGLIGAAAQRISIKSSMVPRQFEEEDLSEPTEAAPLVWEDFDRFVRLARKMEQAAGRLERAALGGAEAQIITAEFQRLGATCSACHRDYRVRK
ncbi:MAG: cytochrome c [Pseudomonadota bacterium]